MVRTPISTINVARSNARRASQRRCNQRFCRSRFPSIRTFASMRSILTAGQEVLIGGDWYDAFAIPGGRIVVSIGDVTGHGLNAAVSAGRIRQSIVATAIDKTRSGRDPHESEPPLAVARFDGCDRTRRDYRAATHCTLRYASAGHPSPIHAGGPIPRTPCRMVRFHSASPATPEYRTHTAAVWREMSHRLYTDGITEFTAKSRPPSARCSTAIDAVVNVAVTATGRTNSTRGSRRRCTKRRCGARRASRCTARPSMATLMTRRSSAGAGASIPTTRTPRTMRATK